MKSLLKIQIRYAALAAGIALLLLVLNIAFFLGYMLRYGEKSISGSYFKMADATESLVPEGDHYEMPAASMEIVKKEFVWAMLLDEDGKVVWSWNLPRELDKQYSIQEVAAFSKWYLMDYPVKTYIHPDGIAVYGQAKGSVWKNRLEMPEKAVQYSPQGVLGIITANILLALGLAALLGYRLYRSLRPLGEGIERMEQKEPADLEETGPLADLAARINRTSLELARQQAVIQKKDTARTTWIAGVSHDIRTPLSLVMGYASQLEESPNLTGEEHRQAAVIRTQSQKIKQLVSDLNLASKLEYEMQPLSIETIRAAGLLRQTAADFMNRKKEEDFEIQLQIPEKLQQLQLEGDRKLLERAVSNVIQNSIEHCKREKGCRIEVELKEAVGKVRIVITDNGQGFPKEVLRHQGNGEMNVGSSHGLGLKIVQQIARAHGGEMVLANGESGGRVTIELGKVRNPNHAE
jgi:signal transduction histidine kinase